MADNQVPDLAKELTKTPNRRSFTFFTAILRNLFSDELRSGALLDLTTNLTTEEIEVLQAMLLRVGSDLQKAKEGKLRFYELESDNESFRKVKENLLNGR